MDTMSRTCVQAIRAQTVRNCGDATVSAFYQGGEMKSVNLFKRETLLALAIVLLSGCDSMTSRRISQFENTSDRSGIPYSAPMARVHIVLKGSIDLSTVHVLSKDAKGTSIDTVKLDKDGNQVLAFSNLKFDNDGLNIANTATDIEYGPDPEQRFTLKYAQSPTSDDTLTVAVEGGLLTSINTTVTDQSFAIVESLVDTAAKAFSLFPEAGTSNVPLKTVTFDINTWIDPANAGEVQDINGKLSDSGLNFEVIPPDSCYLCTGENRKGVDRSVKGVGGIYFREAQTYTFKLSHNGLNYLNARKVNLPNKTMVHWMDLTRLIGVAKTTNMVFDHGMLTNWHLEKKSELLAASQALNTLVGEASGFVKTAASPPPSSTKNAKAAATNAQAAATNAQARKAVAEAKKMETGSDLNTQVILNKVSNDAQVILTKASTDLQLQLAKLQIQAKELELKIEQEKRKPLPGPAQPVVPAPN